LPEGRGPGEVGLGKNSKIELGKKMGSAAHQADCLAKSSRERMDHVHCRIEAAYKGAISIPISFESPLSFLKESKDVIG